MTIFLAPKCLSVPRPERSSLGLLEPNPAGHGGSSGCSFSPPMLPRSVGLLSGVGARGGESALPLPRGGLSFPPPPTSESAAAALPPSSSAAPGRGPGTPHAPRQAAPSRRSPAGRRGPRVAQAGAETGWLSPSPAPALPSAPARRPFATCSPRQLARRRAADPPEGPPSPPPTCLPRLRRGAPTLPLSPPPPLSLPAPPQPLSFLSRKGRESTVASSSCAAIPGEPGKRPPPRAPARPAAAAAAPRLRPPLPLSPRQRQDVRCGAAGGGGGGGCGGRQGPGSLPAACTAPGGAERSAAPGQRLRASEEAR